MTPRAQRIFWRVGIGVGVIGGLLGLVSAYFFDGSWLVVGVALAVCVGAVAQLLRVGHRSFPRESRIAVYSVAAPTFIVLAVAGLTARSAITWLVVVVMAVSVALTIAGVLREGSSDDAPRASDQSP